MKKRMSNMDGDDLIALSTGKTPGSRKVHELVRKMGIKDRAATTGEVMKILKAAVEADGGKDAPAVLMSLHLLDYMAIIGVPLASPLYYIGLKYSPSSKWKELDGLAKKITKKKE